MPEADAASLRPAGNRCPFETNTAGWFNFSGATITRVPSGSSSTYANGVAASAGNYYARLGQDTNPDSCTFGVPATTESGLIPVALGTPFTTLMLNEAVPPPGVGVEIRPLSVPGFRS